MTLRALLMGLLLGLGVAGFTHYNDRVIGQMMLVGTHLPPAIFGSVMLLVLTLNPLLGRLGARWPLRTGELVLIAAMGLAVCGWPGSNFFRHFMQVMALPATEAPTQTQWKQHEVFSYVPGGSPRLAEGYIADWPALARAIERGGEADAPPLLQQIHESLDRQDRRALGSVIEDPYDAPARQALLSAINRILAEPGLIEREALAAMDLPPRAGPLLAHHDQLDSVDRLALRRAALESLLGGVIKPPPAGSGVLLATDRYDDPAVETLVVGGEPEKGYRVLDLPWGKWWPVLRLWGGMGLLLGLGCLCLVMIVHPQWMRHELLPYPTVRFLEEVTTQSGGRGLPAIAYNKLFWIGLSIAGGIHLLNGLHTWYPLTPQIPLTLNFWGLRELFPTASRTPFSSAVFTPPIYLSVIGFGFFVTTRVSLSIGVSALLWMMLGASVLATGNTFTSERFSVGGEGGSLRFGAYVGMTLMILYFGRRFYLQAAASAVGLGRLTRGAPGVRVPWYSVWGVRGLIVCYAGMVWLIWYYAGLDWPLALMLVAMLLMAMLVLTRVNVETGLFFAQTDWLPGVVLLGFLGGAGLGPEAMVVLTLAGVVLVGAPREAIMPYLANAWAANDRIGKQPAGRSGSVIGIMVLLGFAAALIATFAIHYKGGFVSDTWPRHMARGTFNNLARLLSELNANGELVSATGQSAFEGLTNASPYPGTIGWTMLGMTLVIGCAVAAIRLPWWPLHPVLFIIWGTYPMGHFSFSFLLAAGLKYAVTSCMGAKGYHQLKPLMVGVIAGELIMILFWCAVGVAYYQNTEITPNVYHIAPG